MSQNIVERDLRHALLMLTDLTQLCGHLSFEVQQCTASPNLAEVPSASRLGGDRHHLDRRACALRWHRPSHPTIGHMHQGNLRL